MALLLGGTHHAAAQQFSGGIFTSENDGLGVNVNQFTTKADVYLNGGPQNQNGSGLPVGTYYFEVTTSSGSLLSTDNAECRQLTVGLNGSGNGVVTGATGPCPHANGLFVATNGSTPVQLIPFGDSPNGVYKARLISQDPGIGCEPDGDYTVSGINITGIPGGCIKSDNFSIQAVVDCQISLQREVSCDGGSTFGESCNGWNEFDSTGDGQSDSSAEEVIVRYTVTNDTSDTNIDVRNCMVTDNNGQLNAATDIAGPITMGDSDSTSSTNNFCSETLDAAEGTTADVICDCFFVDVDTDTGEDANASDGASFDCQTPDLLISKTCADFDGTDNDVTIDITNTGNAALSGCTVSDEVFESAQSCPPSGNGTSVSLSGVAQPFGLPNTNDQEQFTGTIDFLSNDACNQATVTCDVTGTSKTVTRADDAVCNFPCGVTLTKEASCAGGTPGDGIACWNAFGNQPAEDLTVTYTATNTGDPGITLQNCMLTDTNGEVIAGMIQLGDGLIGAGGDTESQDVTNACSETLDAGEPDTGTVTCDCMDGATSLGSVSDTDTSDFDCQTPGLSVSKDCAPQELVGNAVTIDVANTGDAVLQNCQVTDEIFENDLTCPPQGGSTGNVAVTPSMFGLMPNDGQAGGQDEQQVTGTVSGLMANACNQVSVTCDIAGTDGPKTVSDTDDDLCETPGDGCFTRTGGFWGTHPDKTEMFLSVNSCGFSVMNRSEALQDLCISGQDAKGAGTSMQQLQLVRQCTVALLNINATNTAGGDCETEFPGITQTISDCCSDLCTSGASKQEIGNSGCIGMLNAFNNEDFNGNELDAPFENMPAEPDECRDARGDGSVNNRNFVAAAEAEGAGPGKSQGKAKGQGKGSSGAASAGKSGQKADNPNKGPGNNNKGGKKSR